MIQSRKAAASVVGMVLTATATCAIAAPDTGTTAIRPFTFRADQAALAGLRQRIAATQWPEKETVPDQSQGVPLATMRELARYWATDYDWRKVEATLNALPQFITEIDGLDIHFIDVRSKHENAMPLVVSHGWPGSIIEQLKIIDPLVNPTAYGASAKDAFDVVIRSMPGYGFSASPPALAGARAHGPGLGRPDEAPGLHPLRRAGRRTGRIRRRPDGLAGAERDCSPSIPTCPRPYRADVDKALLAAVRASAFQPRSCAPMASGQDIQAGGLCGSSARAADPLRHRGFTGRPGAAWLLDHNDADAEPAATVAAGLLRKSSEQRRTDAAMRSSTTSRCTG